MQTSDPVCNVYLRLIPVEEGRYCVLQTIRHPNLSVPVPVEVGIHPHMIEFIDMGIRLGAEPIRILHALRCACVLLLRLQCRPACLHHIHMTCISLFATQSNGQWVARHPILACCHLTMLPQKACKQAGQVLWPRPCKGRSCCAPNVVGAANIVTCRLAFLCCVE